MGLTLDFSRPGKPTDYAFIGAFNSNLHSECVNTLIPVSLRRSRKAGSLA